MARIRVWLAYAAVTAWIGVTIVIASAVNATHTLGLPVRAPGTRPVTTLPTTPYTILHVLSTECGCSLRIVETLLANGPMLDELERVALVGDDATVAVDLAVRGFDVDWVSDAELSIRYGLDSVPTLVVLDATSHAPLYVGGYAPIRRAAPRHEELIAALRHQTYPSEFPIFGCAVNRALQAAIDPLGLKYIARSDIFQ